MTRKELMESVFTICGNEKPSVNAILEARGLPEVVRFAAENAFMTKYPEDKHTERIRYAMRCLHDVGHFEFGEEQ